MKTRIISALVGAVILAAVLICPWLWVFGLVVSAAAALATYELLHNTSIVQNKWMLWISVVFAAVQTLDIAFWGTLLLNEAFWPLLLYTVFSLVLFIACRKSYVWKGYGLTLYASVGFGTLGLLRIFLGVFDSVAGIAFVLLPMVIAWMSDTGAYFTGVFFGKHKMAPVISPKKTWEGFFGGWVISVGLTVLYGVICNALLDWELKLWMLAIIAVVLAPLSVVGDLLASLVKRRTGIKDYGNIMPGHGGVMDRFDSVVFIAPMTLLAMLFLVR